MYSSVVTVTPEIAKEWLKKNVLNNRKLSLHRVNQYADDIKNGRWQLTPQSISFNERGELVDGQHRLNAVIKANTPVDMYVTNDVPNPVTIIDMGGNRTVAQQLVMKGVKNIGNRAVSTANLLLNLHGFTNHSAAMTMEFCEKEAETLGLACNIVNVHDRSHKRIVQKACCGVVAWECLMNNINELLIRRFFTVADTGFYDLPDESSAIAFRNYLIEDYNKGGYVGQTEGVYVCRSAIRDFLDGKIQSKKYAFTESMKKPLFPKDQADIHIKSMFAEE